MATGGSNATFLQGLLSGEQGLNSNRLMNHFISWTCSLVKGLVRGSSCKGFDSFIPEALIPLLLKQQNQ